MKVEEWIQIKKEIEKTIKICGYVKNEEFGNWERQRKNNVMCSVVYLNEIPEDLNKIPVMFINTEDRDAKPSDRDIDTILERTRHMIRKAIEKYNKKQEPEPEVVEGELIKPDEKPTPTPKPQTKQKAKPPTKKPVPKSNVPAIPEKPKTPAKVDDWRQGRTDAEIAKQIENAEIEKKTKEFVKSRGKTYTVSGNERPDSYGVQQLSNVVGGSLELRSAVQNDDYCEVVMRAHLNGRYVDAVVHHDFKVEKQLLMMEMVHNRPEILDHYDGLTPIFVEGATVRVKGKEGWEDVPVLYWIIHTLLKKRTFAIRDARTKAGSIAELAIMTGMDARDPEEIESENQERIMVQNSIETEKAMRRK